jgi:heme exporter protein A
LKLSSEAIENLRTGGSERKGSDRLIDIFLRPRYTLSPSLFFGETILKFSSARLVVEDLTLERGGRPLFRGLDFSLASGEALIVTGPNGSGKSTLLRALAGLLRPAVGRISLVGFGSETGAAAVGVHYVGHSDALKPAMTALENVAFWAAMLDIGGEAALSPRNALERLGLGSLADLPVAYLSAGQKRRVALTRLLVAPRPLWLLDEPTSALDAVARATLEDLVCTHLASGGLAVLSTHAPFERVDGRSLRLAVS